jgi:hypothetical protein
VTTHGGRLIKSEGEGDSTGLVFPRASDAVNAALGLQQAGPQAWVKCAAQANGPRGGPTGAVRVCAVELGRMILCLGYRDVLILSSVASCARLETPSLA